MEGKKQTTQYEPIVFINSPISDDKNDVIGIYSIVAAIRYAAENDARMIGIIADYGTGKSSLTETLARDKKLFGKAITINMWDSLSKEALHKDSSQIAISGLTKSFLFQLASGISDNAAKHINRMLSKNYGIISFSISSKIFWMWIVLAAIAYIFFAVISGIGAATINNLIKSINPGITENVLLWLTNLIKNSFPLFMVAGIVFAVIGLRSTSIAFSHWKAPSIREPEVNDVFEAYIYIYKKLISRNKHRLVIIEDLDRIGRKNLVVGFLKEIYRFNSLPQKTKKKSPVFVISVKPECYLKDYDDKELESKFCEDDVYSKLFDYTVALKPIHYVDYGDILLKIIGDKESTTRSSLQSILEEKDRITNDTLPASFAWIITGHNLTIRQLKDRLNCAVSLLVDLKNKNYRSQSYINFSSCAAVTYLESQYSKQYSELIKQEDGFSKLVQTSFSIRNEADIEKKNNNMETEVKEILKSLPKDQNVEHMKSDIVKMLLNGDISDDFRMYFYSFPRGTYIQNGDERDISNLLSLPNDYPSDSNLDEKIERIIAGGKESSIISSLTKISNLKYQDCYPSIIVQNEFLFQKALAIDSQKTETTVHNLSSWDYSERSSSREIIRQLSRYSFDGMKVFWSSYALWLKNMMDEFDDESIIDSRKQIISIFGDKVIIFKGLFEKQLDDDLIEMPIITEDELYTIPSMDVSISLINAELIDEKNIGYVSSYINQIKLNAESYEKARNIYSYAINNVAETLLWQSLIAFLKVNEVIDIELFSHSVSGISGEASDKEVVSSYINSLSVEQIPKDYCDILDIAIIDTLLSGDILQLLYENKCFVVLLSSITKANQLHIVDFTAKNDSESIISACEELRSYDATLTPKIRKEIIEQFRDKDRLEDISCIFLSLFRGSYPIITAEELNEIDSVTVMLKLLNRKLITIPNSANIIQFINDKAKNDECLIIFRRLFSKEYDDEYPDDSIATSFIDSLDYTKIGFCNLNDEDKETILKYVDMRIKLKDPAVANNFMIKSNCLVPILEKIIIDSGKTELYIDTINQIDAPTNYTIEWLINTNISFALSPSMLKIMLNKKQEGKYLIGKVLSEKKFEFPFPDVSTHVVVENYSVTSPIWSMIRNNSNLANNIIQSESYKYLNESEFPDVLKPLYNGKQTIAFVSFLFTKVADPEKIYYLNQMGEILDAENSIAIANLLVKEPYIMLLKDKELFYKVRERLWEEVPKQSGYKGSFTRKRNQKFPSDRA